MHRLGRAALTALAAFLIATPATAPPPPGPGGPGVARLFAQPVALDPGSPDVLRLGSLRYLGGWRLRSDDRRFGAISGLAVDSGRLIGLSDQGILFRFAPPDSNPGAVEIIPLKQGPGGAVSKVDRDSEAMTMAGAALWVGYENSNEIWRYRVGDWQATGRAAPSALRRWSANRGAESLVRLPDGRFLAIREDVDDAGVSEAALFLGDPSEPGTDTLSLKVDPPERQRVTDAAVLPDGRLLLLTRGFSLWTGWTARLLLAELPGQGEMIATREVAAFAAPLTRDNMEALAVSQEDGRTIVWIASDDNLFALQQTLLLKFEWNG